MSDENESAGDGRPFAGRESVVQVEEGDRLAPRFDACGLIPVVTSDAATGEVLMLGYMNADALARTIATGEAHYWSRSRQVLWHKGATSGFVQHVVEMRIDDDQDAVWLRVRVAGDASCHVGYRSCFYRHGATVGRRKPKRASIRSSSTATPLIPPSSEPDPALGPRGCRGVSRPPLYPPASSAAAPRPRPP